MPPALESDAGRVESLIGRCIVALVKLTEVRRRIHELDSGAPWSKATNCGCLLEKSRNVYESSRCQAGTWTYRLLFDWRKGYLS